ncbi:peptidase [Mycobacterium sp. IS-1590]|uniref:Type 1 glutamine amidotransferase-like domain-containing protein n=1 Tax=Mycobacterium sp. IS-1590 TaxID=1772286 RepID=UPI000749B51D|nr:Type 1 glutamine amidotransferase-like domain-containing protein [Mycobacterium sp. IS-1590]KUI33595.1 peptidase [Mycobacterium sp. IS-1590]
MTSAPQSNLRPLYLLADSQLLFWKRHERLLLERAVDDLARDAPLSAAYIGASNGDRRAFYDIFQAAMDAVGIADIHMVGSSFGQDDRAFLERARVIVLAGGDVRTGWNVFESTGMADVIRARYTHGAVLVGISAGAIQLGRYGIVDRAESVAPALLDVFGLVPAVIDTHDEHSGWARLSGAIDALQGAATGIGVPSGGGIIVHDDATFEPLRRPAHELRYQDAGVVHSLLCPAED